MLDEERLGSGFGLVSRWYLSAGQKSVSTLESVLKGHPMSRESSKLYCSSKNIIEYMLIISLQAIILSAPRLLSEKQVCHNSKYFTVLELHNKPFPFISERSSIRIRRKRRICLTVGEWPCVSRFLLLCLASVLSSLSPFGLAPSAYYGTLCATRTPKAAKSAN